MTASASRRLRRGSRRLVTLTTLMLLATGAVGVTARAAGSSRRPIAGIDRISRYHDGIRARGWTYDPSAPTTPLMVTVTVDGRPYVVTADHSRPDVSKLPKKAGDDHGFRKTVYLAQGTHTVCIRVTNVGHGSDLVLPCRSVVLDYTPTASLAQPVATATGVTLSGWAADPDTTMPVKVALTVDGRALRTVTAHRKAKTHSGHAFATSATLTSGTHRICAVALNTGYGSANSPQACRTITLALNPFGAFESLTRDKDGSRLDVTGWAIDPDTSAPIAVGVSVDAAAPRDRTARTDRPDIAAAHPGYGSDHGLSARLGATTAEHTVCLTARNVSGGVDTPLGCRVLDAVHPVAPGTPRAVTAKGSYEAAIVSWHAPASDGGAPPTYVVTATPGTHRVTAGVGALSATVKGLKAKKRYSFTVRAVNVAGTSPASAAVSAKTLTGPPPQRSPAPVSTSRYIRNISTGSGAELARMRSEGVADAKANPANHRYLVLLDIGGQDQADGGVVLSATTRFVPYATLVRDLDAYADGYHSAQHSTAPATIAVGTNNDMDVSSSSGKAWATSVVNRVASHTRNDPGLKIAGANDMEPGFRASYSATRRWLRGYLAATSAPFVFNGSADGCAWTYTGGRCNNGWTMAGLYTLAAGAAPTRTSNLPQIYNTTMAAQWKYISLTGVVGRHPRIAFGGPLTEWTACAQAGGCGSLTGRTAWSSLWHTLQSDARLRIASLPYSTDLRIDR